MMLFLETRMMLFLVAWYIERLSANDDQDVPCSNTAPCYDVITAHQRPSANDQGGYRNGQDLVGSKCCSHCDVIEYGAVRGVWCRAVGMTLLEASAAPQGPLAPRGSLAP